MHSKNITYSGVKIDEAKKVLIMLHGRGGTAADILSLASHLPVSDFALVAPEATNQTWYPYSFLAAPVENEPWLSGALGLLKELVDEIVTGGIPASHIYFLGFSQGACLTLEYVARNGMRYGGVAALTGGLIGDRLYPENYSGDFVGTPIFIGTSNPDPHVPVQRVLASEAILKAQHASVTVQVYKEMGHTISTEEMMELKRLIF